MTFKIAELQWAPAFFEECEHIIRCDDKTATVIIYKNIQKWTKMFQLNSRDTCMQVLMRVLNYSIDGYQPLMPIICKLSGENIQLSKVTTNKVSI